MQDSAGKKITLVAELNRIHLRFINVSNDAQLTGILSKILQSLLMVYLESDLVGANIAQNPKIAQLDEIMTHLTSRVTFSKGGVKAPVIQLLNIVNTEEFSTFGNAQIRQKVFRLIMGFIKVYSDQTSVAEEDQEVIKVTLKSLQSDTLPILIKSKLFVLCLHRMMVGYLNKNEPNERRILSEKLAQLFEEDFTLKKSFIHFGLLFVIAMFPNWENQLRPIFIGNIMEHHHLNHKLSQTQFVLSFENAIYSLICQRDLFDEPKEYYPILLIASTDGASAVAQKVVSPLIKTVVIEYEDLDLSAFIYQMILGNFGMFFTNENEQNFIQATPFKVQQHLITHLMRFPAAVVQRPFNLTLVDHCLFNMMNVKMLQKQGLNFIRSMLRSQEDMGLATQEHLKHTLERVRQTVDGSFSEESRSMSCLLLAELAARNYHLVFGSTITLAIDVFDALRERVQECNYENKSVRMDDIALTYMEAINKMRDCLEQNLKDESNRQMLSKFVENYLSREGSSSDGEIIYILFLYLARLGGSKLSAAILLHSIVLKTHKDIKIKKEAQFQLDRFAKAEPADIQGLLQPFLHSLKPLMKKYLIIVMDVDNPNQLANAMAPVMDVSSAEQITLEFIDKVAEMSKFALDFYKRDLNQVSRLDSKQDLEKLFLINLHDSFQKHKSNFTESFKLIESYLNGEEEAPILSTQSAAKAVSRLSHGQNCVNLEQKMLGLKLLFTMVSKSTPEQSHEIIEQLFALQKQSDASIQELPKGHEIRLSMVFRDTMFSRFSKFTDLKEQCIGRFMAFSSLSVTEKFSPNQMELQKMIANSMAMLAKEQPLRSILTVFEMQVDEEVKGAEASQKTAEPSQTLKLDEIIDKLRDAICNRTLDINFRSHLLRSIGPICHHDAQKAEQIATSLIDQLKDYDSVDFQHVLGKALCDLWLTAGKLAAKCDELIELVDNRASTIELTVKRNYVVYLHQIITVEGTKNQEVKDRLLPLQKIFLKFLFDKRASMQDLASKSLSTVYSLGDEETRRKLVESLSASFTGQLNESQPVNANSSTNINETLEEIKEQELAPEFRDNFSSEQKKKIQTYKDLTHVANQLGSKQLIYQFLEIHRSLNYSNDVQSAAKGLSNIIMLDSQLKADLVRLAPNILLLTYDKNKDVSHTMRELWTVLIDIDQENQIIEERWNEIYEEAFKGIMNTDNPRNKLRAVSALSDLMGNRTWPEIQKHFRVIFLTSLAGLDSEQQQLKAACYKLAKILKSISLRLGNVYTNGNENELRQVLSTVIPMILDDCLKSGIQPVRWFGLDLLSDIVMTAQSQNVAEKLKIKSKHERQLMFNHNSQQKIKEILNSYMERIIVELIGNSSAMIKAVGQINMLEQLAIEHGYLKKGGGNAVASQKYGISETEINQMRTKMTKESTHGEILRICREMMNTETFDKILTSILQLAKGGHDIATKSTAVTFITDIVLEGKLDLISPKNSRMIARRMVEIHSQTTVQASLDMKESLQGLYASCLGSQMKILRDYENTVKQLLDSLADLEPELEIIKVINLNEMLKALPESLLTTGENHTPTMSRFIPNIFVNRYKSPEDNRIKSVSKRVWDSLESTIPNLAKISCPAILEVIATGFESTQYDDRVASAEALKDLCGSVSEAQLEDSNESFEKAIDAIITLISQKYFPGKEKLVECFSYLVDEDYIHSQQRKVQFLQIVAEQAAKASGSYNEYKNELISSIRKVGSKVNAGQMPQELIQEIYDFLIVQLTENLELIVSQEGSGMMAESNGIFFDFNEKREEDKATLKTVQESYSVMPRILLLNQSEQSGIAMLQMLTQVSEDKFVRTNWLVRQAILLCFKELFEQKRTGERGSITLDFGISLVIKAAEFGEKYEQNLMYLSSICLPCAEALHQMDKLFGIKEDFKPAAEKLITLLQDKGSQVLIQNVDLIKRFIGEATDVEMVQE